MILIKRSTSLTSTAAIYIVKTELEALCCEIVANNFQAGCHNALYYLGDTEIYLFRREAFVTVAPLHFRRMPGLLGKQRSIRKALTSIVSDLKKYEIDFSEILIHLPKLSATRTNYVINFLRFYFPLAHLRVRLIPHGTVNFSLQRITWKRKLTLWRRWATPFNLLFPDLQYYIPSGDWVGGLDVLVDRIYVLPNAVHPYPETRVFHLPRLIEYLGGGSPSIDGSTALVIGQPALRVGAISQTGHSRISARIKEWLSALGVTKIYYSKHPRARDHLDFYDKSYLTIDQAGAIETLLPSIGAGIVVSCFSTALFTSRMLLGEDARVVSIGINLANFPGQPELLENMRASGIEIIDA